MIRPDFLQKGDTIAIVCPSGPIKEGSLDFAIETLNSWGLQVKIGKNVFNRYGVFAGTDEERAADFQEAIDDKEVKAILCARGGYGAIRIINRIDFSSLIFNPKWIIGFSDITVFHSRMSSLDIQSIHGVMAKGFGNVTSKSLQSLHDVLFGVIHNIQIATSKFNHLGKCKGQLVGGNLSMLYSMRGVDFEYDYNDKILFIEDLNEYFYHIDRIMQNLKHSGILQNIAGLVVGTMSGMRNGTDEYSGSIEEIILDAVDDCTYPVVFNFPSGHEDLNQTLIIGAEYSLTCSNDIVDFSCMTNKRKRKEILS
ncbi:MAG: LD-carboxypeptidase [Bacteroidales bacterium]|nr:LD-carboxypeptidase [Bacteroidales bacterium]